MSGITEFAVQADGTRIRQFDLGGVRVQVRAIDADNEPAAAKMTVDLAALAVLVTAPPARATSHGDGQFDLVELAPGLRAAIRVTGGELTITAGAAQLGLGLLEASRRAAEHRVRIDERGHRRKQRAADAGNRGRR